MIITHKGVMVKMNLRELQMAGEGGGKEPSRTRDEFSIGKYRADRPSLQFISFVSIFCEFVFAFLVSAGQSFSILFSFPTAPAIFTEITPLKL